MSRRMHICAVLDFDCLMLTLDKLPELFLGGILHYDRIVRIGIREKVGVRCGKSLMESVVTSCKARQRVLFSFVKSVIIPCAEEASGTVPLLVFGDRSERRFETVDVIACSQRNAIHNAP